MIVMLHGLKDDNYYYDDIGGNSQKLCCVVVCSGSEIIHHDSLLHIYETNYWHEPISLLFCKTKKKSKKGVLYIWKPDTSTTIDLLFLIR